MGKKYNIEYIKEYSNLYNYKCLDEEYKNPHIKLKFICVKEHLVEISWNNFKRGKRCRICSLKIFDIQQVNEYLSKYDYLCLSDTYINIKEKLIFKCPNNHIYETSFNTFKNGGRCPECSDVNRYTYNYVKTYVESFGYKLIDTEYVNCDTKINLICPIGHHYKASFNHFKNNSNRCRTCFYEKNSGENNPSWNPDRESIRINKRLRKNFKRNWIIKHMKHDPLYNDFLKNPKQYQVDHIYPISAFTKLITEYNIEERVIKKITNKKENLQLLHKSQNSSKGNKYNEIEFNSYLLSHGLNLY